MSPKTKDELAEIFTRIYGESDDLIEVEGEYCGEVGCPSHTDPDHEVFLRINDGTELAFYYGKNGMGVWNARVLTQGSLFDHIEECTDEDADIISDVVCMKQGITEILSMFHSKNNYSDVAEDWQKVE